MLVFALTFGVQGAQAYELPNTVYLGTDSGGGTVEFHVDAGGAAVDYFKLTGPPGTTCGNFQWWLPHQIVNHAFAVEEPPDFLRGTFGADDTASGTLRWANTGLCHERVLTWTATAAIPPPPIPPPPLHPPWCHVQKVGGKTLAAAKRTLASSRCEPVLVTRTYSRRSKKGRVLRQHPRPGTWLPAFSWVRLVVGRGPRH
jgi:hypothetical protein